MDFCSYYQAQVARKDTLFFVAILRSFDHICFDRTLDPTQSLFEFFVPPDCEKDFLTIMTYFQKQHIIDNLQKQPNRLMREEL